MPRPQLSATSLWSAPFTREGLTELEQQFLMTFHTVNAIPAELVIELQLYFGSHVVQRLGGRLCLLHSADLGAPATETCVCGGAMSPAHTQGTDALTQRSEVPAPHTPSPHELKTLRQHMRICCDAHLVVQRPESQLLNLDSLIPLAFADQTATYWATLYEAEQQLSRYGDSRNNSSANAGEARNRQLIERGCPRNSIV